MASLSLGSLKQKDSLGASNNKMQRALLFYRKIYIKLSKKGNESIFYASCDCLIIKINTKFL